jgi:hypothetical protein
MREKQRGGWGPRHLKGKDACRWAGCPRKKVKVLRAHVHEWIRSSEQALVSGACSALSLTFLQYIAESPSSSCSEYSPSPATSSPASTPPRMLLPKRGQAAQSAGSVGAAYVENPRVPHARPVDGVFRAFLPVEIKLILSFSRRDRDAVGSFQAARGSVPFGGCSAGCGTGDCGDTAAPSTCGGGLRCCRTSGQGGFVLGFGGEQQQQLHHLCWGASGGGEEGDWHAGYSDNSRVQGWYE